MAILAVQAVKKMRGGSQAHLLIGDDGSCWVTKGQGNPQPPEVLVNEYMVSNLAFIAGLKVPESEIIELTPWLAENSRNLYFDMGSYRKKWMPGLHCGSRLVNGAFDFLPDDELSRVTNLAQFSGFLALDKWTNNRDRRQAVFYRKPKQSRYTAVFIDHGHCFCSEEPDPHFTITCGGYYRRSVYERVTGWSSFSPWLERFEGCLPSTIRFVANQIPMEWFGGDATAKELLVATLIENRAKIRERIIAFKKSDLAPFPNWIGD